MVIVLLHLIPPLVFSVTVWRSCRRAACGGQRLIGRPSSLRAEEEEQRRHSGAQKKNLTVPGCWTAHVSRVPRWLHGSLVPALVELSPHAERLTSQSTHRDAFPTSRWRHVLTAPLIAATKGNVQVFLCWLLFAHRLPAGSGSVRELRLKSTTGIGHC